ncbi:MAG: hypothetical protein ACXX52_01155 [Candidatus Liberibacter asiaticus]|uniref:hypothetical protein n=1 Tax=Liberibacter asiaticus TaxID=34021 RepID=UPI0004B71454|nr:hypothetical protein [Candidatus Liberibacter asiaticus]MBA2917440.1 hypothetical protein [Candidatus Liberibacter asiaticus]MBE2996570.1 hypothetical protein [Candidatus Liberibacter asiaticus]QMV54705.1 hypothetical protein HUE70_02730 [Candidatus Liberibacter asiaticus]UKY33704.1 hypothetical protein IDJ79_02740 [Candidatus Liberibacter asiaticus]
MSSTCFLSPIADQRHAILLNQAKNNPSPIIRQIIVYKEVSAALSDSSTARH